MSNLVDQLKKVLAEQEEQQETLLHQQLDIEKQLQMLKPGIAGLKETISNIEASLKSFTSQASTAPQPKTKAGKQKTTQAKPAEKSDPVAKPKVEKPKAEKSKVTGKTYGLVNWAISFFKTAYENTVVVTLDELLARTYGKEWHSASVKKIVGPGEIVPVPFIRLGKFNPEAIKLAQEEFVKLAEAVKGQQHNNAEPSERMKALAATYSKDFEAFEKRMMQIFESASNAVVVNDSN
jgi:hypothetical protein